jgi:hypothetical protein
MNRRATLFVAATLLMPAAAWAQETATYPDVEYISGKSGVPQKMKGDLVIAPDEIVFKDKKGNKAFSIPTKNVVSASGAVEHDPGSFGRKAALGVFASKREEFLTVKTSTPEGAEAVVFKTKKKTAEAMAAKIEFFAKKQAPAPK